MRRFISLVFILSVFFVAFQCEAFAGSIKWNKNLDIGISCFNDVTQYSNGLTVAVGEDGVIKTSSNGITWTGRDSGTTGCLNSVACGQDRIVAVGEEVILTSSDAIEWQAVSSVPLQRIIWTGSQYIAVGKFGAVVTSDDGDKWTSSSVGTNENLCDVYYSGTQFIALGENGGVYTSFNAKNWSKGSAGFDKVLKSVSWNGSRYVIVTSDGAVLTSLDCKNWSWVLNETAGESTAKGGKTNAAKGALHLGNGADDIIWDGKIFVIAGSKGGIFTSTDGIKWNRNSTDTENNLHSVVWTGTQFVAVGENGSILTSPDSRKWTSRSSAQYSSPNSNLSGVKGSFRSVVWGKNRFVAAGDSGVILYSADGFAWSRSNYKGDSDIYKVIWNGKKYAAVGSEGMVLFSNDGVNWTKSSTGIFSRLNSIAWNGKLFVAVGETGEILTSSDGVKWTLNNTGVYKSIDKIVWDRNLFVAVEGKNDAVLISSNGINWTRSETIKDGFINGDEKEVIIIPKAENMINKVKDADNLNQVIWNGTEYIGVGELTESNVNISGEDNLPTLMGNSVMTSVDGIIWSKGEIASNRNINSIAWNGEMLVAVGDYSTILSSIPAYIKVMINGKQLVSDIPPIIRNSRTLVPLRAIFETLGLSVDWDESTKTITGVKGDVKITLKVGSADATVGEKAVKLDSPATIVGQRTVVPVRFIAESLGAKVTWDKATKTVIIKN